MGVGRLGMGEGVEVGGHWGVLSLFKIAKRVKLRYSFEPSLS